MSYYDYNFDDFVDSPLDPIIGDMMSTMQPSYRQQHGRTCTSHQYLLPCGHQTEPAHTRHADCWSCALVRPAKCQPPLTTTRTSDPTLFCVKCATDPNGLAGSQHRTPAELYTEKSNQRRRDKYKRARDEDGEAWAKIVADRRRQNEREKQKRAEQRRKREEEEEDWE
jgi:hypothetical protein